MRMNSSIHHLDIHASVAAQLDKLCRTQGRVYDEHQRDGDGFVVKTIARFAVWEREGEQFLIPVYDGPSCVNPLLDHGGEFLTLSKRTIGSMLNGKYPDCLARYNANENNLGRFISEVMTII